MTKIRFLFIVPILFIGLFGLVKGADAAEVYYSVGQNTNDQKSGLPTVTITGGAALFSVAQTGNIGVGDRVTYNTNQIAYISSKTNGDQMHWTLVTATGGVPGDVTDATVNSIAHEFTSLSNAIAGATDPNHLGTSDLFGNNFILNIPAYYDSGPDTTPVTISGYTTGANNYIKIYTPYNTSTEVNQPQRHQGKWDTGKYRLEITNFPCCGNSAVIDVMTTAVQIEGLQILMAGNFGNYPSGIRADVAGSNIDFQVSQNIIQSTMTNVAGVWGIYLNTGSGSATTKIWNNLIYNMNEASTTNTGYGIDVNGGASGLANYWYNNTVINSYIGYSIWAGTAHAKNNMAQEIFFQGFYNSGSGSWSSDSDYNISNLNDAPGVHSKNLSTVIFVDATNKDFHLASTDTTARDGGMDLSTDLNLAIATDLDGEARPYGSLWDIGADEYWPLGKLMITSAAQTVTAGGVSNQVTLQAEDWSGNLMSGSTAVVNLSSTSPTMLFSATSTFTTPITSLALSGGTGTFYFKDTAAGTPSITAASTSNGLASAIQSETISIGSAAQLLITTPIQTVMAGAASNQVMVLAEDIYGNLATGSTAMVNLSSSSGTMTFSTTSGFGATISSITLAGGTGTFYFEDTAAGTPTIALTSAGLTSAMQSETIGPGFAAQLVMTSSPQTMTAGAVSNPVTVVAQDIYGNPANSSAAINLSSNSATMTFSTTSGFATTVPGITLAGGTGTFYFRDAAAGVPAITAASTGLTSAIQNETIMSGGAAELVITTPIQTVTAGVASNPVTVVAQDIYGNPANSFAAINLSSSSGTMIFSSTSSFSTTVSGIALAGGIGTFYFEDTVSGVPTITAASTGLTSAIQTETIASESAAQLLITTAAQSVITEGPSHQVTVVAQDIYGNPANSSAVINLSSSSGTMTFSTTSGFGTTVSSITLSGGVGTFYFKDTATGTPTITAASAGLTSAIQTETVILRGLPSQVYYSVGQNTNDQKSGLPTVTITGGAALFSVAQTGNIGVGDRVTYNTNQIAYISSKTSADQMHWTLVTATGSVPADVTDAMVNSIAHEFPSLANAIAGATDTNHLGTSDLFGNNFILNIPAYYDSGPDTTPVTISGYTTGASNYIKIYTPYNTSTEVNQSQRHQGKWDTGKYRLEITNFPFGGDSAVIEVMTTAVQIEGLQILMAGNFGNYPSGIRADVAGSNIDFQVSQNIIQSTMTNVAGVWGIYLNTGFGTATTKIWNNLIYNMNEASTTNTGYGIDVNGGATGLTNYWYNNTVINSYIGYSMWAGTTHAKNNMAQQNFFQGFYQNGSGSWSSDSDYNISNLSDAPGVHSKNSSTVTFVDATNKDFHLASTDTTARDGGLDLSADLNLAIATDLDGEARPYGSLWDIGADEYWPLGKLMITSAAQTVTAGGVSNQVTLQAEDWSGNLMSGSTAVVNLSSTSPTMLFSATSDFATTVSSITLSGGIGSFYFKDTTAGTPTITMASINMASATESETIQSGSAEQLVITTAPQTVMAGAASNQVMVLAEDIYGNLATGSTAMVNLSSSSGTMTFSTTSGFGATISSITLAGGTGTFYFEDTAAGTPTITLASTGLTSAMQMETIGPALAAQLVFSAPPLTMAGAASIPMTVLARDMYGNQVNSSAVINLSSNSGTMTFSTTSGFGTTVSNITLSGGIGTFYFKDTTAGSPAITAASTGLTSATQSETIEPGIAAQLVITTAAQTVIAGIASNLVTVVAQDIYGNPANSSAVVNLYSTSGTMIFSSTSNFATTASNITLAGGIGTVYFEDTISGTPVITAASTGLTSATQIETISAESAAKLMITTAAQSLITEGPSHQVTVVAQDIYGNPANSSATINLSSTSGTMTFSTTSGFGTTVSSITLSGGVGTFFFKDSLPGSPVITAASAGLTSAIQTETVILRGLPNQVYYSVGQNTNDQKSGLPTVTITGGAALFSVAQTGNIGVGDRVTYNTNQIAYISSKTSTDKMHWTLVTSTGAVPADVTDAAVNSIAHEFTSLSNAIAGATDSNHLGTSDLYGNNFVLNLPAYYDSGPDTTPAIISGYTTGANNYIKIYTPYNTSTEVNQSQRHQGKWDTGKYRLEITNFGIGGSSTVIEVMTTAVHIEGIQILMAGNFGQYPTGIRADVRGSNIDFQASQNIIQSTMTNVGGVWGIFLNTGSGSATAKIGNNLIYNMNEASTTNTGYGIDVEGSATGLTNYWYNNTVINSYIGYSIWAGTAHAKNNMAQQTFFQGFFNIGSGTWSSDSDNNVSNLNDAPGVHSKNSSIVTFVDATNNDFHLASTDTTARDGGLDLSADLNLAIATDLDGEARPYGSLWDIGADEYWPLGKLMITSAVQTVTAGEVSNQVTLQAQDWSGNLLSGSTAVVNLSSTSGTMLFSATSDFATTASSITLSGGIRTFYFKDTTAGTPALSAISNGLASGIQTETISPPPATHLVITTSGQTVMAGAASNQVSVVAQDAYNNLATGSTAVVNLSSNSGTMTFSATSGFGTTVSSITLSGGAGTFYFEDTSVGTATITALSAGLTSVIQAETILPLGAPKLVITSSVQSVTTGMASNPVTIQAQDLNGNLVTGSTAVVNLSSSSGTMTFSTTSGFGATVSSITLSGGIGTFYFKDLSAGSPILIADSTGLFSAFQTETLSLPVVNIYYSVGQNNNDHKTGNPVLTISSGMGTFSIDQIAGNMGVGDQVTYNTNQVAFISGRISNANWTLVTATGGVPSDITGASVNSITHAFGSLPSAIDTAFRGVSDASHLNTTDLVSGNYTLNLALYYDSGPETAVTTADFLNTDAKHILKLYTPFKSSEANQSQRHSGVWNTMSAWSMDATLANPGGAATYPYMLWIPKYTVIDGLQMRGTYNTDTNACIMIYFNYGSTGGSEWLSNNIFKGNFTGTQHDAVVIEGTSSSSTNSNIYIWNNMGINLASSNAIYGELVSTGAPGNWAGNIYVYNNSIYNASVVVDVAVGNIYYKNNLAKTLSGSGDIRKWTSNAIVDASSDYNATNQGASYGIHSKVHVNASYVSTASGLENLHLIPADTVAKDAGMNLSTDSNFPFATDIDGQARPYGSAWDIGADENWPAGPATQLFITTSTQTVTARLVSSQVTVIAEDVGGNLANGSTASVNFLSTSPSMLFSATSGFSTTISGINLSGGSGTFYFMDTVEGTPVMTVASTGLTSATQSETITPPDTISPVITAFVMPSTANSLTVNVNNFTASDANSLVTGYLITESSSTPSPFASGWTASPPTAFTFGGSGSRTAYAWAKDPSGNVSVSATASVTITLSGITNIYYSVGQNTTTDRKSGFPTLTLTAGAGLFSLVQTGNIGVGDKVTYNGSSIAYIAGKTNSDRMHWNLITATGTTPPDVTNATVNSITRAFASLAAAQAGSSDANHLNTKNLVTGKFILNLPCYYDSGPDISSPGFTGWTTDLTHYLQIYTPASTTTEANQSQRHAGKWTPTAFTVSSTSTTLNTIRIAGVSAKIFGLQISLDAKGGTGIDALRYDSLGTLTNWAAYNIIRKTGTSVSAYGVRIGTTGASVYLWNNIIYGFNGTTDVGIREEASSGTYVFAYNNTLQGNTLGVGVSNSAGRTRLINNLFSGNTASSANTGSFASGTDYNTTDNVGLGYTASVHDRVSQTFSFIDSANKDLHLISTDTGARDFGLTNPGGTLFLDDVDGQTRPFGTGWDIGADEFWTSDSTPPVMTSFTMPGASSSATVSVSSFTATDPDSPVTGYLITESSAVPSVSNPNWSGTPLTSFTFAGSGTRIAYGWARDGANNISASVSQTVTITLPSATQLKITSLAQSVAVGVASNPVTIQAQDGLGNLVSGSSATVNLTSSSGTMTFSATSGFATTVTSITLAGGTGTFYFKDTLIGTPTVTAVSTGLTSANQTEAMVAGGATKIVITSLAQSVAAGVASNPVTIQAQDGVGNLVTGSTAIVNFSSSTGTMTFSLTSGFATTVTSITLAGGTGTFYFKDTLIGTPTVTVTSAGLTSANQTELIVAGLAAKLMIASLAQSVTAGVASNPLTIQAQDGFGNMVTSSTATVNLSSSSGTMTFSTTSGFATTVSSITLAGGIGTVYFEDTVIGTPMVTAASTGLTSANQTETITAVIPPDTTAPTIMVFAIPSTATSLTVSITTLTANDNLGVTGYFISESSTAPSAAASGWTASPPTVFTFGGSGLRTAYAWVKDAAGNVSASAAATVTINLSGITNVYYSVGQNTTTDRKSGSPTLNLTSGAALFSVAQTGNIGVGDKVTYNGSSIVYISGKTNPDQMHWTLITATGTTPTDVTNATVNSITRAFASLAAAQAGSSDANHLATTNLVTAKIILYLPCYYDSGPDKSSPSFTGWTTDLTHYLQIYTPVSTTTEANQSQRHTGKWTPTAFTVSSTSTTLNTIRIAGVSAKIYGLQISLDALGGTAIHALRYDSLGTLTNWAAYNIIRKTGTGTTAYGIRIGTTGATVNLWNNIIYGFNGTADAGIREEASSGTYVYAYNNTLQGNTLGVGVSNSAGRTRLINNLFSGNTASSSNTGSFATGTDYNATDNASLGYTASLHDRVSQTFSFMDSANKDFHLISTDTGARDFGLTNPGGTLFSDDIDIQTRLPGGGSSWDIGADEFE